MAIRYSFPFPFICKEIGAPLSNFTPPAQKLWAAMPSEHRLVILNSVWCGHCRETTSMLNITGSVKGGDLVLQGKCERCANAVGRLVESE